MSYSITATREFSAAHQLRLYDGSIEPLHGHNWRVRIAVESTQLDSIGVVMDFHDLEHRLNEVVSPMHNRNLNDLEAFRTVNPTAENVAVRIATALNLPPAVRLQSVEVWETAGNSAIYRPE